MISGPAVVDPRDEFAESLTSSGLLSDAELRVVKDCLSETHSSASDVRVLAHELVHRGVLTRYQASAVYQGRTAELMLGDYVILEKLGAGGMGEVFKAYHRRMKRVVAIKLLSAEIAKTQRVLERFQREVETTALLLHPNIVAAYDAGEQNGVHYLVMEFVDGKTLREIVRDHGPLSASRAVKYIIQAARGLGHAHGEGVVHRDIKPSNMLLDRKDVVRILDMGLARPDTGSWAHRSDPELPAVRSPDLTQFGAVFGTPDFMAPEQAIDCRNVDERADIYSLGCSLYYLLTGKPLFPGGNAEDKIDAHRLETAPSLRILRPDVPESLDIVYQKMVRKRVDQRHDSADELITALSACDLSQAAPIENPDPEWRAWQAPDDVGLLGPLYGMPPIQFDTHLRANTPPPPGISRASSGSTAQGDDSLLESRSALDVSPSRIVFDSATTNQGWRWWGAALIAAGTLLVLLSFLFPMATREGSARMALLTIQVSPEDASVFIDGRRISNTSQPTGLLPQLEVTAGNHLLSISKAGYQSFVDEVFIEPGQFQFIPVDLVPLGGSAAP